MLNFLGPNDGEGFIIYYDAGEWLTARGKGFKTYEARSEEIVIGWYDDKYSSVVIDELLFFNRKLSLEEIQILSNMDE